MNREEMCDYLIPFYKFRIFLLWYTKYIKRIERD